MGTMLQAVGDLSLTDDFLDLEGCNEILNVTRPDVVAAVHRAYFEAGADAVETNTFGTNLAALAEYDIVDRLEELAEAAARIAREVADEFSTPERPRFVLGSIGPGTKLPTLGHVTFAAVRDAYQRQVAAMIRTGDAGRPLPLAGALRLGRELGPDAIIAVSLSGRGDKDMDTAARWFGLYDEGASPVEEPAATDGAKGEGTEL